MPDKAPSQAPRTGFAPAWHTVVVLCVMFGVSLIGAQPKMAGVVGSHGRWLSYVLAMAVEWGAVAFIAWGLHRRGLRFSDLVGGSWARPLYVLRDLGLGIAFLIIFGGAVQVLTAVLKATPPPAVHDMLPQTPLELMLWVPLSLTGGFCEEVIFRGYLQRQFAVLTHSLTGGIVLQAIVFGSSHGYQGWKLMSIIALYGACFGWLAHWRRSLRPGMIGHALQDTLGGLLAHFTT